MKVITRQLEMIRYWLSGELILNIKCNLINKINSNCCRKVSIASASYL